MAFWDLFGERGVPVRTTVSEMGPQLLARLLELNDTQEGVLVKADPNRRRYAQAVDRRSAHAVLCERMEKARKAAEAGHASAAPSRKSQGHSRESAGEAFVKSMATSLGSATGRRLGERLLRGVLGSLLK